MIKSKSKIIFLLSILAVLCIVAAGCNNAPLELKKELPTRVTFGEEIYFREYIPFEYGAEYELFVSYTDKAKDEVIEDKKLDSLIFKFETVATYDFRLQRKGGGKEIKCTIDCYPEVPILSDSYEYEAAKNEELYLTDILFWCGLSVVNSDSAEVDPDFRWEFSEVTVKASTVDGEDETVDLSGKESFVFDKEAVYEFKVKAVNKAGSAETILSCNSSNPDNHYNKVTGYIIDDQTIEFEIPDMSAPADGETVKTRLGETKYDAVYDAETKRYKISQFNGDVQRSTEYRLYVNSPENVAYSTLVVAPDLVLTKDNINELELVTEGYVILKEDIDMTGINWATQRTGNYADYWFKGTLDGRGYAISNFTTGSASYAGGLLWSADGATIKNIIVKNAIIKGSNSVITGRSRNMPTYENIAVEVKEMNMYNSGVIAGPSEFNNNYKNCLMYVRANTASGITGSGFMGGLYAQSVNVENVYAVTTTDLPLSPSHASIVTAISGEIKTYTAMKAKEELLGSDLGNDLLNRAAELFFSGAVEVDPDSEVTITQENIEMLMTATKATYILGEDIDMKDVEWHPVSDFQGVLDGNGHKIDNFTVMNNDPANKTGGLFYRLKGATIKNLVLDNVTLEGAQNGVFCGRLDEGGATFENVFINIVKDNGSTRSTGLIGYHIDQKDTVTLKNVFINMPKVNSNAGYRGFISSHAGGKQILDGLYCTGGNGSLHSTDGNHATYIPVYLKADGKTQAVKGVDYFIYDSVEAMRSSEDYTNVPEFIKTQFESIFPSSK